MVGAVGAVLGLVVGLFVGGHLLGDDGEAAGRAVAPPTTLARIAADPREFVGESAAVTGTVTEIISPRAFALAHGFGGPQVLVVTKAPLSVPAGPSAERPLLEGDIAQVTGDVRTFEIPAFERDMRIDLRPEADFFERDLRERVGDPAIQARTVFFESATTPVVDAASAEEIAERPGEFYGRIASVEGRITEVLPAGALVVDGGLLVLTADLGQARPEAGQQIRIVGPVRPFDPDQRRSADRRPADENLLERFGNRPSVVAQSLEIER